MQHSRDSDDFTKHKSKSCRSTGLSSYTLCLVQDVGSNTLQQVLLNANNHVKLFFILIQLSGPLRAAVYPRDEVLRR